MRYRGVVGTGFISWIESMVRFAAMTALAAVGAALPLGTSQATVATVTTLSEHPADFVGKWVSVKSRVIHGRGPLILTEGNHRILISEPGSDEVGRFDSKAASWGRKLVHIQGGYGHLVLYAHRLVIRRVTSVAVVPNP